MRRLDLVAPAWLRDRWKSLVVLLALGSFCMLGAAFATVGNTHISQPQAPAPRSVKAWVLASPSAVAVPPPPASGSVAGRADASWLRALAHRGGRSPSLPARWRERPPTAPWTELSLALVSRRPHGDPPIVSRAYALVSVAMDDAVTAASYWRARFRRPAPGTSPQDRRFGYPSQVAVIAGAASRVLAYAFPERPPAELDRLAEQAAGAYVLAGQSYPSDARAGLALGRAVAAQVIRRAHADGSSRVWHGRAPQARGFWGPAPWTNVLPVEPLAGTWRTWVLTSGSQFRPPPPPRFGSPQFLAEIGELVRLRRSLTPEQMRIAKFWEGGKGTPLPPGVWNEVALAYVRRDHLDAAASARVFALMNVAMADTGVAAWDAKFTYWSPRPETAIRELGTDSRWTPFLATPPFPAYVSAHSAFSGAASEVLAALFPKDAAAFRAKAVEAGLSRLYGGIHYRSDHTAGLKMGQEIGRLVLRRRGFSVD